MGWSDENIARCKVIGDRAGAHVWLANQTIEYYEHIDNVLELVITLFLFIFGSSGISTLLAIQEDYSKIINLILQSMIILSGVLSGIKKWLDYKKRIRRLNWYSTKCSDLFLDIEKNLNIKKSSRKFPKYYKEIQKKEFILQREMPYIPKNIIKKYYKMFQNHALSHDILFDSSSTTIEIYAKKNPTNKELDDECKKQEKKRKEIRRQSIKRTERNIINKNNEESETEYMEYSEKTTPKTESDDDPTMIKIDISANKKNKEKKPLRTEKVLEIPKIPRFQKQEMEEIQTNSRISDSSEDFTSTPKTDRPSSRTNFSSNSPMKLHTSLRKSAPNTTMDSMRKNSPKKENKNNEMLNIVFADDIKKAIRKKRARSINEKRRYELERYFL